MPRSRSRSLPRALPSVERATRKDARLVADLFNFAENMGSATKRDENFTRKDAVEWIRRDVVIVVRGKHDELAGAMWFIAYATYVVTMGCAVASEYRGCGTYEAMSRFREQYAKGFGCTTLTTCTLVGNRRMQAIFRKQGYSAGERVVQYSKDIGKGARP